jgi:hypothetical protein
VRRFVFALALALLGATWSSPAARADQTVVQALVYNGQPGPTVPQQVDVSALNGCTPYSGPNPIYLYQNGQATPDQLPSTTWALSTVLTCALQLPLSNVTGIQVAQENAYQGFEAPLTAAQLSDPNQFQDPQAPSALPVISTDGSEDLNTYVRPWLGGSDNNAADQVVESNAPVTIAVYENSSPLVVHVSWTRVSENATTIKFKFGATVQTATGALVPASSLSWSWSFQNGPGSTAAAPTHSFPGGVWPVSVQMTDIGAGTAGTATVDVTAHASPAAGQHTHRGGSEKTTSNSPVGPEHSSGASRGGPAGNSTRTAATSHRKTHAAVTTTSDHASSHQTAVHSRSSKPGKTKPSKTKPAKTKPARTEHPARKRIRTPVVNQGHVVQGLLISDVTPVAPGASPLVRDPRSAPAAPPVRQATSTSSLAILLSGLVILALFGLGAGRELRSSRRARALRLSG